MFGIGIVELFIILVVALLVIGPERLPEVARQLGRGMRAARQLFNEFRSHLDVSGDDDVDTPPQTTPSRLPKQSPEGVPRPDVRQ